MRLSGPFAVPRIRATKMKSKRNKVLAELKKKPARKHYRFTFGRGAQRPQAETHNGNGNGAKHAEKHVAKKRVVHAEPMAAARQTTPAAPSEKPVVEPLKTRAGVDL